jgi:ammonia channel protein AmtB
LHDTGKSQVG